MTFGFERKWQRGASPITVWNGTGYTTYTPGIDDYTLRPYEAFFIQKPDGAGAPETITFIR